MVKVHQSKFDKDCFKLNRKTVLKKCKSKKRKNCNKLNKTELCAVVFGAKRSPKKYTKKVQKKSATKKKAKSAAKKKKATKKK
jgi:hypothetical protein